MTQLEDFPGTPRDDAAAFSSGTAVHVGTGMEVGWNLTNDWWTFDVASMSWSAMAPLPASGRQYCSTFFIENKGYLFGGVDASGPLNELWEFDLATEQWTQRASLPGPGRSATVAFESGPFAFICTGMLSGGIPTNEVWRYDPFNDVWDQRASFPGAPRHRATGFGSYPWVIGGADQSFQALADGWSYDSNNDEWNALPDLPSPRYGAAGTAHFGPMLFCGASGAEFHDEVFDVDLSVSMDWTNSFGNFAGGGRKGAVAGQGWANALGWTFCGLGSDASFRYKDWYGAGRPVGIPEEQVLNVSLHVHPNPVDDRLFLTSKHDLANATFIVNDGSGRVVMSGNARAASPIVTSHLAPGRYELVVLHNDHRSRAAFVKLP